MYMAEEPSGQIERFPPLMLHSILSAVRRFEPDFYNHICRVYHLDVDRILGLFTEVELLGPGQIIPVLENLREHQANHDILMLSGRNAFLEHAKQNKLAQSNGAADVQFEKLLKEELPRFLGNGTYATMVRGKQHFVEIWNSVFARGLEDERTLCSFYAGFMCELGKFCSTDACSVSEVRCCAVDRNANSCLFQVNL